MSNELSTRAPGGTLAQGRPETPQEMIVRIAAEEKIPPTGLTILGGKPYVNTTGLDVKLRTKCEDEHLVHVGTEYIIISEASKENGMRASGWGVVRLFDKAGFEKSLAAAAKAGPISKEIIDTLKELYYHVFKMRGFASPETLGMASMKLKDNVEHMAERRATNRAKREATGTGLTSIDEMPEGSTMAPAQEQSRTTSAASQTPGTQEGKRVFVRGIRAGNPGEKKPHFIKLANDQGVEAETSTFQDDILEVAQDLLASNAPGVASLKKVQKGDKTYLNLISLDPVLADGVGVSDGEGVDYDGPSEGDGRDE